MTASIYTIVIGLTLFIVLVYNDHKRRERESHEAWLSSVRLSLKKVEYDFRCQCENITEEVFEKYSDFVRKNANSAMSKTVMYEQKIGFMLDYISAHEKEIENLSGKYISEIDEKVKAIMGQYSIKTVPASLKREFETNTSEIVDIFKNIHFRMRMQILEMKK